ncbi:hypothetical protein V2J09_022605, partial [Rumex salicifolius]
GVAPCCRLYTCTAVLRYRRRSCSLSSSDILCSKINKEQRMATEQNEAAVERAKTSSVVPAGGAGAGSVWAGKIEERYMKAKENVEGCLYVYASYALVYGGFGLWFAYRWTRLRRTESRVRGLQTRLQELVEAQQPQTPHKPSK